MRDSERKIGGEEKPAAVNEMEGLIRMRLSRRQFLHGTLNAAAQWVFFANIAPGAEESRRSSLIGFQSIPISHADEVIVPPEYSWQVVSAWGDPVVARAPEFKNDASQSGAVQALQ